MRRPDDPKLKHVHQMKTKVAEEVFLHHVLASLVEKHGKCLRHLAVSNEGVVLDVQVPHFHEVLLSGVDVREVVDHL